MSCYIIVMPHYIIVMSHIIVVSHYIIVMSHSGVTLHHSDVIHSPCSLFTMHSVFARRKVRLLPGADFSFRTTLVSSLVKSVSCDDSCFVGEVVSESNASGKRYCERNNIIDWVDPVID